METGITELKRASMMREWFKKIAECRNSGKSVKPWCNEQGIAIQTYYRWGKRFAEQAAQQLALTAPAQAGLLMRVNPDNLPGKDETNDVAGITINRGESIIILPSRA